MKLIKNLAVYISMAIILIIVCPYYSIAGKKKISNSIQQADIQSSNEDGNKNIYGSVLDPNVNQILLLLPKSLLNTIRKMGLSRLKFNITSTLDSTKAYTIPANGISVQRKRVKGASRLYLVANFSSTTTSAGITLSPSSLPSGDYRIRTVAEEIDLSSEPFNYETPVLIVGSVKSSNSGFVNVEDANGKIISDNTVPIGTNGGFITEVRANKFKNISTQKKLRENDIKSLTEIPEQIPIGLIHAVTEKEQFAITPLNNDVESNALKAKKPIEVNDGSTFTATIGKEYEKLASEAAKNQLEKLQAEEEQLPTFEDFGCDIYQFADRCSEESEEVFTEIGLDFRNFIKNTTCSFPEFDLIKESVGQANDEDNVLIGKGYCESLIATEINEENLCEEYSKLLNDFNQKLISNLPCPPLECIEFSNIKPPKCGVATDFCNLSELSSISENPDSQKICLGRRCKPISPGCIVKPVRDPFCARIGTEISETDCYNQNFFSHSNVSWITATNSKGNTYCVPTSTTFKVEFTPSQIAEECEVNTCHKQCEEDYRTGLFNNFSSITNSTEQCEVCDCHKSCDIEAGRLFDCTGQNSSLFSSKCCGKNLSPFTNNPSNFNFQPFPGKARGPIVNDYRECLCRDINNFNENGIVKPDDLELCKNSCPEDYEIDSRNENICLPVCEEGLVRDSSGFCRKKCPPGFIERENGNCECPEGKTVGPSGKCEEINCPEHCKNIPIIRNLLAQSFNGGGSGTQIPPECFKCFGGQIDCSPGYTRDNTGNCVINNYCGTDQYKDQDGICRCTKDGSIPGPSGCTNVNRCSSNLISNNTPGEASCICPQGLPYWDNIKCVASCPNGNPTSTTTFNLPPKSPISCTSTNQRVCGFSDIPSRDACYCAAGATPIGSRGECRCTNGQTYTSNGCGTSVTQCPPATPYLYKGACVSNCPSPLVPEGPVAYTSTNNNFITNGAPQCLCPGLIQPDVNGQCSSSNRVCQAGEIPSKDNCGCASPGYTSGAGSPCQCPPGYNIAYSSLGCGTYSTNYCSPGIAIGTGCTCNPSGGTYNFNGYCTCPSGSSSPYTKEYGCGSSTTTNCPSPYITNPAGNPPCKCPDVTPISNNATCVSTCPQGLIAGYPNSTGSGYTPMLNCLCPDKSWPNSSGQCTTNTTNYCSPGIAVGTNGCTCNPSGGGYSFSGYCTCPSGFSTAYTATTGCSTSSSHICAPGEAATTSNPCYCASGGTFSSTSGTGTCQCTNGQTYTSNGCSTTTTSYCSPGTLVGTLGCTCNPSGGAYSFNGYCTCPNNQAYTASTGCGTTTSCPTAYPIRCPDGVTCVTTLAFCPTTTPTPSPTPTSTTCNPGSVPSSTNSATCICSTGRPTSIPCQCASGSFSDANGICQCPTGQGYTTTGCKSTTRICAPGEFSIDSNPCTCAGTAQIISGGPCSCPSGQTYSVTGCSSTTSTPSAVTNLVLTLSSSLSSVILNWQDNSTNETYFSVYRQPNGAGGGTNWTLLTSSLTSNTTTYTDSNVPPGSYQYTVYACNASGCSIGSNAPVITVSATSTPTPTPTDSVTLSSVVISGNGVTVTYNKNFSTCAHLLNSNNTILHTQNIFCNSGNNSVTVSSSQLNSSFQSGTQVKLCHGNNYNICSQLVTITGVLECVPGETATSCVCGGGAQPNGRYGSCKCSSGFIYHNSNYTNSCRRMCSIGEAYNSSSPCSCGPYGTFGGSGGSCSCSNGRTYDPFLGCERPCNPGEISQGSDACICAGSATYDSQNKCTCPSGQSYTTNGCGASETITLNSVSISGSTVTIDFSASSLGGSNCAVLKDTAGTNMHPSLALCFNNGPISYDKATYFTSSFQSGLQVHLCNTTTNVCSGFVIVTGN